MGNKLANNVNNENGAMDVKVRKQWNAPQMTVVSISDLTEAMSGVGSDGAGGSATTTFS
jgi:hypothetical protein